MSYIIKQKDSDFLVREIIDLNLIENGEFSIFSLEKENTTSIYAIEKIAESLNISYKDIGFCGMKDKNAKTFQYISMKSQLKQKAENIKISGLILTFVGFSKEGLHLGMHTANKFEIVVRNLDNGKINLVKKIPNYFGEQRFSKHNIEIGRYLIKKEYANALELIKVDNKYAKEHIDSRPNDYIGAIKTLNEKIITIYIHAYQSYIFNEILSNHVKKNAEDFFVCKENFGELSFSKEYSDDIKLPLIGFDTEISKEILEVFEKENINFRDFINRQLPFLTVEETLRDGFVELKNLAICEFFDDELNPNKKKVTVSFVLPKGSFATIAIRAMFY